MAAKAPQTHIMQTFEQLLGQCDPDEIPEMVARLKTKLARHRQALNSQHSLLLTKLPPELLVEIGRFVLGEVTLKGDKAWFRQVLPLLQTCVHLRAQLRPLFSTALICEMAVSSDRIWDNVFRALAKWDKGGESYRGHVVLIINVKSTDGLNLSTAAAMAGALKCAIHGSLWGQPSVYVRCTNVSVRGGSSTKRYVSHCRDNMLSECSKSGRSYFTQSSPAEAISVWNKAGQMGRK